MADTSNSTADNTTTGVGQQDPSDSTSDPGVIAFIARQLIAQLEKMKLVKVVKVTGGGGTLAAAGTVDVQLLVNQLDGAGNAIKQGVVYSVPWYRLAGGKSAVVIDPVVGDIGYVLCEDRDISNVKAAAAGGKNLQANPGSFRRNSISDGIYVGAVLTKDVPEQYLWFKPDGGLKLADKFGNVVETSETGITITPKAGTPVTIDGSLIVTQNLQLGGVLQSQAGGAYAGLIATTGDVTAGGKSLKTHTHTQPPDSHGDTEQPTSAPV